MLKMNYKIHPPEIENNFNLHVPSNIEPMEETAPLKVIQPILRKPIIPKLPPNQGEPKTSKDPHYDPPGIKTIDVLKYTKILISLGSLIKPSPTICQDFYKAVGSTQLKTTVKNEQLIAELE